MAVGDHSTCTRAVILVIVALASVTPLTYGKSEVSVRWGVADTTATVGKLFRTHIPSDAFSGKVLSYNVQRTDGEPLSAWLELDSANNVLQGIPTPKDAGQLYLEIVARGEVNQASVTFTVFVRDIPSHTSGAPLKFKSSGPELVRCKQTEPETVATIVVDVDIEAAPVSERMSVLRKFLGHMELHEDMVKMVPVGNSPIHDSSALVSGAGDGLPQKTSGAFISWPVGCGQVKEGHFPVLQRLDDDSGNGRMAQVLGYPIIGWHVTNSHIQAPVRKRRQVHATPTPAVTPVMPTKTGIMPDKTDDTADKMTHTVVDKESPTFIQPTATQPPMTKTVEPTIAPPRGTPDNMEKTDKIMPTMTTPKVTPVSKTKVMPPIKPTKTVDSGGMTDKPFVPTGCVSGSKPQVKNPLPKMTYNVGDVIEYVIPADTFEDCEVGGTRGLELMLFKETTETIPSNFFVQFDNKSQKIIGIPMDDDIGRYKMNLVGHKLSNGLLDNVDFIIHVRGVKNKNKINHELSISVDYDYDKFMANAKDRAKLANRVASIYGDPDSSNLQITIMARGSVQYGWTNRSLSARDCPTGDISALVDKLVNKDGTLTKEAIEKLKPFTLLGAAAKPAGQCEGNPDFPAVTSKPRDDLPAKGKDDMDKGKTTTTTTMKTTKKPGMDMEDDKTTEEPEETTPKDVAKGSKGGREDDVWITTVVPAVVIVVILLIALLIACILYRKKRKGKMNVEEQNTFINKGAPVIFPDELEDKPSDVNKPLLVEGSPAPPPEYHRNTSESPEPAFNNHRNNINNTGTAPYDDSISEMPEKPYEPPPPVTASTNNKQPRLTHQQQPFSQPPQILP